MIRENGYPKAGHRGSICRQLDPSLTEMSHVGGEEERAFGDMFRTVPDDSRGYAGGTCL